MSKRSTRRSGRPPSDTEVALLRPRLQPLSIEQRAEAAALLCELLLTAARRAGAGGGLPAADGERREEELAA